MGKPRKTQEDVIKEIHQVHGDKYDTSLLEYVNNKTKVKLICHEKGCDGQEHGEFLITPGHLLSGQGCPKCRYVKSSAALRRSIEEIITLAREVHGDKYDYSLIKSYKNDREKLPIICPEHGIFYQTMNNHIKGKQGCPVCGRIKSDKEKRITFGEFVERALKMHKGKYAYNKPIELQGNTTKVTITCPEHGDFEQTVANHLQGQGCPKCRYVTLGEKSRSNTEEFKGKIYERWGDRYDLSKVDYYDNVTKICVICPKHGEFMTRPHNLLTGYGCPKCGRETMGEKQCSEEEKELYEFLKEIVGTDEIIPHNREILNGYEVDYYIPKLKLCVEYDGLYWHSETFKEHNYHSKKSAIAHKCGMRMIHVFSDEWKDKNEIVKSMLRNITGQTQNKIFARKTSVVPVENKAAYKFMETNHIQGKCTSSINLGLEYDGEIVALMSFGKCRHFIGSSKHQYELMRFCSKLNTEVVGGASKLFKHFVQTYNPKSVVSYADLRWSEGKLYDILGFNLYNISRPNYFYIKRDKRYNRFNFRKSALVKKYGCPEDMSEHEYMKSMGYIRIYDCGTKCYEWINNNQ